jgi:predicted small metal-binding protein
VNSVLLSLYLKGFDRVKDIVSSEPVIRTFQGESFQAHRDFVGNDSLAVYLKDIQLEIENPLIDRDIEIADCQGSDSPNPLHLAMIQDYLLKAHLLVYVISSRTGLRRADIKFLNMIRKMGILENIIFVINCDISEHESSDDLFNLVRKIREELSLIKADPQVFTISALYNLFRADPEKLQEKDTLRLQYWQKEKEINDYLDTQSSAFNATFENKLTIERSSLLLKNHLERMAIMATGIRDAAAMQRDILASDANSAREIIDKIIHHQRGIHEIQTLVKNTLEGASQRIKKELRDDIDRFFDSRNAPVVAPILGFIRKYTVNYANFSEPLAQMGFSNTLYQVFQEFKRHLDEFIAETINPEIIIFVRDREKKISQHFESTVKPYGSLVQDAMNAYRNTINSYGVRIFDPEQPIEVPNTETIVDIAGLRLPSSAATMYFTAKIKTEAVFRFGIYSVFRAIRNLLKRQADEGASEGFAALKDAVNRLKQQTESSVIAHFKDYRENLKFQYMFKLVDSVSMALYKNVLDRFQGYMTDLSKMATLIRGTRGDKESSLALLAESEDASDALLSRIDAVRTKITLQRN